MQKIAFPILLIFLLTACGVPTPTEFPILVDSFFYGYAYIDVNGNGEIDESDPPLEGAILTAVDASGRSGGGVTNSKGATMAWWPDTTEYPATLHMDPPKDSGYTLISENDIVLEAYEMTGYFLFTPPE